MNNKKIDFQYCIKIDFEKHSEVPSRIFDTMSRIIESFQKFDSNLAGSISKNIKPSLLLEEIERGSLKTWLSTKLIDINDDDLRNLDYKRIIGTYLVKAKHRMLSFLNETKELKSTDEIILLQNELLELAQETDVIRFPAYAPIKKPNLLKDINDISKSLLLLNDKDTATLISKEKVSNFNKSFEITPDAIEDLLTKDTIENVIDMILMVKKPDMIGESMWQFIHDNHIIQAKIIDEVWLEEYQNRRVQLEPGFSLKCKVQIVVKYGFDNKVFLSKYNILKVYEILFFPNDSQGELLL